MHQTTYSFFATQNFSSAWHVYHEWRDFQDQLGRSNEVEFAGCRINGKNCWEVLISRALHDARVEALAL